ncbi:uncharacterized protein LOC134992669 [Pseudophryne corroboree]|uniref:uncharacterized protein LOC134992669 n=1 Tax=Pseudophryne corroboree TaxID=495146 RepID=UPI003081DA5B
MSDFTVLLNDLARTCQELEQIKAEQTKDHEKVTKSFEKTLLSILRQEETILNHVEEEHRRLRDLLSSIQQDNDVALHNGVCQINHMVHEISVVSSQLKQALGTSNDSEPVMKEIQHRVANIFTRKNSINICLKKVHFLPQPLLSTTLGEIRCEEQSLGFSVPSLNRRANATWGRSTSTPTLLSDERPPWEDKPHNAGDLGFLGVKILLETDSDQCSGSSTKSSSMGTKKEDIDTQALNVLSKDEAVMEADKAALSPRTATKIWISDIKHSPTRQGKQSGTGLIVQTEEGHKSQNQRHLLSRQLLKESPPDSKSPYLRVNNTTAGRSQESRRTLLRDPKETLREHASLIKPHSYVENTSLQTENMEVLESKIQSTGKGKKANSPAGDKRKTVMDEGTHFSNDGAPITLPDHNTVFRAMTAYVCEGDSETSEDTLEEVETDGVKDPKACRQVAIRDSRVPSAKKYNDGDQLTSWMSPESQNQINSSSNFLTSHLNIQNLESGSQQSTHESLLSFDYMRMSDDRSDTLSKNILNIPPRSVSPSESVNSSYTFIIESPKNKKPIVKSGTFSRSPHLPTKESRKRHPVITVAAETSEIKSNQQMQTPASEKRRLVSKTRNQRAQPSSPWKPVPRSSSMSYIERIARPHTAPPRPTRPSSAKERRESVSSTSSSRSNSRSLSTSTPSSALREIRSRIKPTQCCRKTLRSSQLASPPKCLRKSEPNLTDCPLDNGDGVTKLVKQFGKFGSGRAELNLPHGIHTTNTGSVYVVDYGNRRLQVMDASGKILQQFALEAKNYFDVAVSNRGLVALTNSTDRTVDVYTKHGRLLQVISRNWGTPRGITANHRDEFIVADMKLGAVCALTLDTSTGCQKESTMVTGFNKPYLVSSNSQGLLAVSERGLDGGCCVKVLGEDLKLLKVLGLKDSPGPTLFNPWGVCVDNEGGVLVADWGQKHSIIYYPAKKPARSIVTEGLSSPRGLASWQDYLVLVADSMHNCIKVFQYQENEA